MSATGNPYGDRKGLEFRTKVDSIDRSARKLLKEVVELDNSHPQKASYREIIHSILSALEDVRYRSTFWSALTDLQVNIVNEDYDERLDDEIVRIWKIEEELELPKSPLSYYLKRK